MIPQVLTPPSGARSSLMKRLLTSAVLLLSISAHAEGYVRCEYDSPKAGHRSFVEEKSDVSRWLDAVKKDHSTPNFDSHPRCHPLGDKPIYNFVSQSEGGQVSIVHSLTEEQCETMKAELDPVRQHCGWRSDGCSWTVSNGDLKWSKCFR
jgi:hypothetical protein